MDEEGGELDHTWRMQIPLAAWPTKAGCGEVYTCGCRARDVATGRVLLWDMGVLSGVHKVGEGVQPTRSYMLRQTAS